MLQIHWVNISNSLVSLAAVKTLLLRSMEKPTVLGNKRVHYFDIHDCSLQPLAVPRPGSIMPGFWLPHTCARAIDGHPVSSTKHVSNDLMENEYSQPLYKFTVGLISGRGIGQQGAKVEPPELKTNMAAWDMPWHAKQNMHTVTWPKYT